MVERGCTGGGRCAHHGERSSCVVVGHPARGCGNRGVHVLRSYAMSVSGRTAGAPRDALAIDGGEAVRRAAFPAWPVFSPDEVEAVADVLRSGQVNYWTGDQG